MLTTMKLYEIHTETRQAQLTAVARATLPVAELGPWLGSTYGAIASLLAARQIAPAGPPFARFHMLGDGRFEVEAGFPVSRPIEPSGDVQPSELPGGPVAVTVHVGPYDQMEPAYQALASWVTDHGAEFAGDAWEVFFSDPAAAPDPATWRTDIVQPYRKA
jgi:effector-binding domain-containing protein